MMGSMMRRGMLGDGSTLSLDFTTGVLDPLLTFTRSTSGTYIGADGLVKTATANTARFDYDPITLAPRGLLIEGSAVNLALYSQSFTSGIGWFFSGTGTKSTTNNYATAPDGTTTAARLQLGQNCSIKQNAGTTGVNHTVSIWVKSNTGSNQTITFWTGTAAANRTATTSWTRIEAVVNNASAALFDLYNPNSTDCDILIWGAQLETGSGASSYIPTGASTGSRAADNCYIYDTTSSGGLSWFKTATQGTFYVEMFKRTAGTAFAAAGFGTRATSSQDFMLYQAVGNNWLSFNWGAGEYTTNYSALSSPFLIKAAVALSPSTPTTEADSTVSINGSNSALNTGPNIVLPFTSDLFCIGSRGSAGGAASSQNYAETAIRRIKFFPFAMTAAQMNAMTTL